MLGDLMIFLHTCPMVYTIHVAAVVGDDNINHKTGLKDDGVTFIVVIV